jgi:hypothetical protein
VPRDGRNRLGRPRKAPSAKPQHRW